MMRVWLNPKKIEQVAVFVALPTLMAALWLFPLCGCASHDDGPDPFPVLGITDISGFVEVISQLRNQKQEATVNNLKTISDELVLEERLGIKVSGFSYHPNLIEFTLAATLGSLQHQFEETGPSFDIQGDDLGLIAEFELSADFLRHKPYPGRIHIRQDQSTQSRAFRSSLQTTTSVQGLFWRLEDEKTPLHVRLERRKATYEPLDDSDIGGFTETTSLAAGGAYRFDNDHQIRFEYEHLILAEDPSKLDYSSDELILIHSIKWGEGNRAETRLEYLDQYGNLLIRRLRGRSDVRVNLMDNLTSRLTLEYRDQDRGTQFGNAIVSDQTFDATGGLGYRLWDSVVTNLEVYYRSQTLSGDATTARYGTRFDFNYRKKNALGQFGMNYSFSYNIDDRQAESSLPISIFDEGHSFDANERFILDNRRVMLATIVVTDVTNVTVYREGLDYSVRKLGDEVEFERLLGGTLLASQAVLVDYQFDVGGSFKLSSIGHTAGIRQTFDFGLTLGYLFRVQDQELIEGTILDAAFESFTAHSFRATYRWGKLEARASYEIFDSNITENESIRAGIAYVHAFGFGGRITANADWNKRTEVRPAIRETTYFSFGSQYRQRFFGNLDFNLGARWRLGLDDVSGDTQGINIDANLIWTQGQTEIRGSFLYNQLTGDFSDNESTTILLQIRRTF